MNAVRMNTEVLPFICIAVIFCMPLPCPLLGLQRTCQYIHVDPYKWVRWLCAWYWKKLSVDFPSNGCIQLQFQTIHLIDSCEWFWVSWPSVMMVVSIVLLRIQPHTWDLNCSNTTMCKSNQILEGSVGTLNISSQPSTPTLSSWIFRAFCLI